MSRRHRTLNGRRWVAVRRQVLDRDGWRCQQCGRAGKVEVDHIEALEDGGDPWAPDNLQDPLPWLPHQQDGRGESGTQARSARG